MSHLLDVNFLLACGWSDHAHHVRANQWLSSTPEFATAPIIQMGFMRISMGVAYSASFEDAQTVLERILRLGTHRFIMDGVQAHTLPLLTSGKDVTDAHLVRLARNHSLKLATFDADLCKKFWAAGVAENPL